MCPKFNSLSRTDFSNAYRAAPITFIAPEINSKIYSFIWSVVYPTRASFEYSLFTFVDYEIINRFVN